MPGLRLLLAAFIVLHGLAFAPARAGEAGDLTRQFLESGRLEEGERALAARLDANGGDDEARFGLGMIRFALALEAFGQHHYGYGLRPTAGEVYPFLRMPVPDNPQPERLTYRVQREAFQHFIDDLAAAEATLAPLAGPSTGAGDMTIALDLEKVRFNLTGTPEGQATTLMALLRAAMGRPLDAPAMPDGLDEPDTPGAAPPPFEVAFDRADALWLKGYCRLLSAALEAILAYDWSATFAKLAPAFYPSMRDAATPALPGPDEVEDEYRLGVLIIDAISLVHEVRWPLAEPERLARTREKLKGVVAASRESWQAILAETDDDREWIPSPRQRNAAMPTMTITDERVAVWLGALDDFDAALDGRKLIPHWRMRQGINLRRVLEEPRPFDLVHWASGAAALPYLEEGEIISSESWAVWERAFGGDFLLFAVYLN
jgi:hypothetical protein